MKTIKAIFRQNNILYYNINIIKTTNLIIIIKKMDLTCCVKFFKGLTILIMINY